MNKRDKAILTHAAGNLRARARNCETYKGPSADERKGAAYAFNVSADYLESLRDGIERVCLKELLAATEGTDADR